LPTTSRSRAPPGGPNFFEFGDDVLYSIYIDNDGDAKPDITYQFEFRSELQNPNTFLYNTGPIAHLADSTWNKRQFYTVTRIDGKQKGPGPGMGTVIGQDLPCPPCNVGPRSIPDYGALADEAIQALPSGETVFAGQRNDGFFVDLGAIFDLGDLRPFQNLHLIPTTEAASVDTLSTLNVHTIAIQVPIGMLTRDGNVPTDPLSSKAVIGVWAGASRRTVRMSDGKGDRAGSGPWVQVSRLGNPLFNEVIVPLGKKDDWNAADPEHDEDFLSYVQHPELASLLPVLYPGPTGGPAVFPNLKAINDTMASRDDLVAILLTGIPSGVVPGFPGNFTGKTLADMLRLNVAIPPATTPSPLGLLGGDIAGYPNGRRVSDDVVTIELQAIAGVTYQFVTNPPYKPDGAATVVSENLTPGVDRYQASFPYLGTPHDGFDTP